MKKLLVVLLTVAMVLSLAAIVSAESTNYMGGDFYYRYHSGDKQFEQQGSTFFVGNIGVKAAKDNTWARIFLNTDIWTDLKGLPWDPTSPGWVDSINYAFGFDKIGGIASISFSTKDQDLCNIGQAPLMDLFDDFKADPVFNTYDVGKAAALVIDTDSFTFKSEAKIMGTATPNVFAMEGIFKFDGGKAYVAYKGNIGGADQTLIDGGLEMKLGDMNLKADVWLPSTGGSSTGTTVQGNVAASQWDATLSVTMAPGGGNSLIGVGGNYKLTDALTVGAKYENDTDAKYEVLATYHIGVLDLRAGYVKPGAPDAYFTLGVHAGIW